MSGARCRLVYNPADATATQSLASVKSRLLLPFWYWLTWAVLDKGRVCVFWWMGYSQSDGKGEEHNAGNVTRNKDLLEHVPSHVDRRQSVGHEADKTRVQVGVQQTKPRLASLVHLVCLQQQRNYLCHKQTHR